MASFDALMAEMEAVDALASALLTQLFISNASVKAALQSCMTNLRAPERIVENTADVTQDLYEALQTAIAEAAADDATELSPATLDAAIAAKGVGYRYSGTSRDLIGKFVAGCLLEGLVVNPKKHGHDAKLEGEAVEIKTTVPASFMKNSATFQMGHSAFEDGVVHGVFIVLSNTCITGRLEDMLNASRVFHGPWNEDMKHRTLTINWKLDRLHGTNEIHAPTA